MAATVTANLTDISMAEYTGSGTWAADSAEFDTQIYVQGTSSLTYQTGKNARDLCTFTPASSLDLSATDTHIYFYMRCDVMPSCEAKKTGSTASSGLTVRINSSDTDYIEWHVSGSDVWGGEWKCHVVDINNTSEIYVSGGTLSRSAITKFSWYTDNSNSGTIRIIDNTFLDAVRFGTGLTAYGSDFDYADIEAIDQNSSNMYGIIQEIDGVYFVQGGIIIDDNAGTTTFNSTNETLAFRDIPVSSGLYKLEFTGSGNTTVIKGLSVLSSGSNANTRPDFTCNGTVGSFTMSGSNLNRGGLVDYKTGQSITASGFNNCLQIDTSTATFNANTISNYAGSEGGALLWGYSANTKNLTFIENSNGVELTTTAATTFDNLQFDDVSGKYDVNNTSGSAVTVTKTNSANPNSYNTGGSSVTFTAAFEHKLTDIVEGSEVTYVKQSDTSVLHHVENITATGESTYTHAGGDLVDIMIFHVDKIPEISNIYDLTLPNGNAEVKITQFDDPNYINT